jgi:hypothetical protein
MNEFSKYPRMTRLALLFVLGLALASCAKKDEVIVKTGEGKELGQVEIDRDPLALLPSAAIAIVALDAKGLFASQFGTKLLGLAQRRLPLPASAGFEPGRDLEKIYLGTYSMSGVDVAGVAVGSFDRVKIEAAADGTEKTPLGVPVTKSTYAGRTLYTAGNIGFTVLTPKTALFGNDTGIRRALDRIKEGRARRQLPPSIEKLLTSQSAPLIAGVDLASHPIPNATRRELPFLNGLKTASIIGNFQEPGLNVAGTLGYGSELEAQQGAENLKSARQMLETYGPLLAMFGIPQPVRKLEATPSGEKAEFVIGVDAAAVAVLLERADEFLGVPAQASAVPATTSQGVAQ